LGSSATAPKRWGRWHHFRDLSEGGQSTTYLVVDHEPRGVMFPDGHETEPVVHPDALHVLKLIKDRRRLYRLQSEVEAAQRLEHSNIVKIVDSDLEGADPYVVSRYCSGGTLAEAWRQGQEWRDTETVLSVFIEICLGVAHAHERQVIHRDIKPENIFFHDGHAIVGDFGICYIEFGSRFTEDHEQVGPRSFMAPELEHGRLEDVQPRCDVYSLGKLLYWMRWGEIFSREVHRSEQRFNKLTAKKPLPRRTDPLLYELLDRAIVFDPKTRLQSVNELIHLARIQLRRARTGAHAIGHGISQFCDYCGLGEYEAVVAHQSPNQNNIDATHVFGYQPRSNDTAWRIQVCNTCGHVATFRVEYLKDPPIGETWRRDRKA